MSLTILALAAGLAVSGAPPASEPAQVASEPSPSVEAVVVNKLRPKEAAPAKLDHLLREVDGARIAVTKKATTTKLDQQPTVIDNNARELFARTPGLSVSEQQTPLQFNLSYRGLGNPQESEYVLVLQDGLPISTDWIGFPTLYYTPLPQSVREVQLIRGGNSLIYGPEPAPAVNFVSRRPRPSSPLTGYTEQVGGSDGLYSTYTVIEGTRGPFELRADFGYVAQDGQRVNARSAVRQGDLWLGWRPTARSLWALDLKAYDADAGNPGRISFSQFQADPSVSPTPYNHDWVSRYSATLIHERDFSGGWRLEAKLWAAYQDLHSRAAANQAPGGPPPATTTLQDDIFRSEGVDVRLLKRWGRGNALTVGVVGYHDDAPFRQWTGTNLLAERDDEAGTPRLRQARSSDYASVFAETVFRFGRFHIVPSVRFDHEEVAVDESVRPPTLVRPLIKVDAARDVPLFGLGFGNDFGTANETYFNVSQGWRPLRFFDVASPFSNLQSGREADPSESVSYEAGVHGTPLRGLFYDVSLFWIEFTNRIESRRINATDVVNVNTGDTRHRGFEGEVSYDFLAGRSGGAHLTFFTNLSLLDATFTKSDTPSQVGKTPAFAPAALVKFGLTWRKEDAWSLSLTGQSVASQYWQDSNLPFGAGASFVPAKIPAYTVADLSGDWRLNRTVRLLAGVSNLGDARYYNRVFQTGIEPGKRRTVYAGLALGF